MSSTLKSEVSEQDGDGAYDKGSSDRYSRSRSLSGCRSPRDPQLHRSPNSDRRSYSPNRGSSPGEPRRGSSPGEPRRGSPSARRFIRPVSGNYGNAGGNNNPRTPTIDVLSKYPMTCHFWKNNSCIKGAEKCSYIHGFVCRDDPNCRKGNACRDVHVKLQRYQKTHFRDQRSRVFDKPAYGAYRRDDAGYGRPGRGGRGNFQNRRFQNHRDDRRSFQSFDQRRSRDRESWNDQRRGDEDRRSRGRYRSRSLSREGRRLRSRSPSYHDDNDRHVSRSRSRSLSHDDKRYSSPLIDEEERNKSYNSSSRSPPRRSLSVEKDKKSRSGKRRRRSRSRSRSRDSGKSSERSSGDDFKLHSLLEGGPIKNKPDLAVPKTKETLATMDPEKAASLLKEDMELSEGTIDKLMDTIKAKNKDAEAKTKPADADRISFQHPSPPRDGERRAPLFPISVAPMAPPHRKVPLKESEGHAPPGGMEGPGKGLWTPAMDRPSYDPRVTGVALSRWEIETPFLHRDEDDGRRDVGRRPPGGSPSRSGLNTELDSLFSSTFDSRTKPANARRVSPDVSDSTAADVKQTQQDPTVRKRAHSESSESSSSDGSEEEEKTPAPERDVEQLDAESRKALIGKKTSILKNMEMLIEQKQRLDAQKDDLTRFHRGSNEDLQGILSENALLIQEITKQEQNMRAILKEINESLEAATVKEPDDGSSLKNKSKKSKKKTRKKRKKEKRSKDPGTSPASEKKVAKTKGKSSKEKSKELEDEVGEEEQEEQNEDKAHHEDEPLQKSPVVAPRYWDIVKPLSLTAAEEISDVDGLDETEQTTRRDDHYDGSPRPDHRRGRDDRRHSRDDRHRPESDEEYRGGDNDRRGRHRDSQRFFDSRGDHWKDDAQRGEARGEDYRMRSRGGYHPVGMENSGFPRDVARDARMRSRDDFVPQQEFDSRKGQGRRKESDDREMRRPDYWEVNDRDEDTRPSLRRSYSREKTGGDVEPKRPRTEYHEEGKRDEEPAAGRSSSSRGALRSRFDNEARKTSSDLNKMPQDNEVTPPRQLSRSAIGSLEVLSTEAAKYKASTEDVKEEPKALEAPPFIDQGMHWCELCGIFCDSLELFIEHLRGSAHLANLQKTDAHLNEPPTPAAEEQLQASFTRPLVGVEFIQSAITLWCSLCGVYVSSAAQDHLHSVAHIAACEEHVQSHPLYESSFLKAKMNAYAKFMMSQSQAMKTEPPTQDRLVDSKPEPPVEHEAPITPRPPNIKTEAKEPVPAKLNEVREPVASPRENSNRRAGKYKAPEDTRASGRSDRRDSARSDHKSADKFAPKGRHYRSHREEEDASYSRSKVSGSVKGRNDSRSSRWSNDAHEDKAGSDAAARQNQQSIRVVARAFGAQPKTEDEVAENYPKSKKDSAKVAKKPAELSVTELVASKLDENEKILEELKKKVAPRIREKREAQTMREEEEARMREKEEREAREKLEEKLDQFAKKGPVVEEKKNHSRFPLIGKMPFFKSKPMKSVSGKVNKDSDFSDKDDKERREQSTVGPANTAMQDIQDPKYVRAVSETTDSTSSSPRETNLDHNGVKSAAVTAPQSPTSRDVPSVPSKQGSGVQNQLLKVLAMNKQRIPLPDGKPVAISVQSKPVVEIVTPAEVVRPPSFMTPPPSTPDLITSYSASSYQSPSVTCVANMTPPFVMTIPPPTPTLPMPALPPPIVSLVPPPAPMRPVHYSSPAPSPARAMQLGLPDYSALVNRPPPPPENPSREEAATPPPPGTEVSDDEEPFPDPGPDQHHLEERVNNDEDVVPKVPQQPPDTDEPKRDSSTSSARRGRIVPVGDEAEDDLLPPGIDASDFDHTSPEKTSSTDFGLRNDGSEMIALSIPTKAQIDIRLAEAGQ
ncbi:calponin homology domain-containing protein DDB_G0272472 isoform X2 [Hyalella azteca]|uniref:Calponin homology domain-containing protein DDB_G0272472 isoform X2 n=1 Tax=Hyalella azteca TaxID=294128 RepID=A0A8B7NHQ8_HYAAZ|nr:calponin homology domain-containing protein DDB_G0272472 isoform X2 [Hyalella azteca]